MSLTHLSDIENEEYHRLMQASDAYTPLCPLFLSQCSLISALRCTHISMNIVSLGNGLGTIGSELKLAMTAPSNFLGSFLSSMGNILAALVCSSYSSLANH